MTGLSLEREFRNRGEFVPRGEGAEKVGMLQLVPKLPPKNLNPCSLFFFLCPTGNTCSGNRGEIEQFV